jgi:hypothetical protein
LSNRDLSGWDGAARHRRGQESNGSSKEKLYITG